MFWYGAPLLTDCNCTMHIESTALTERHINSINTSVKHGTNIITIKKQEGCKLEQHGRPAG